MAEPKFCTTADVAKFAGTKCSATSKDEAYVLVYGVGAESYINAATLFNWSDAYGSLNVDVKSILSGIQARLIAIDVINFDLSGFTTRYEAEDMVNILYRRAMDMIKVLKDHASAKFVQVA
jgi:hypothetical protein